MRARARVVVAAGRLAVLDSRAPLVLRRTGPDEVYLVGGAAGPLGGDDLCLSVEVGTGDRLRLRTAAASVALPGPDGAPSRPPSSSGSSLARGRIRPSFLASSMARREATVFSQGHARGTSSQSRCW